MSLRASFALAAVAAVSLPAVPAAQAGWSAPQTVLPGVPASSLITDAGGAHVAASVWDGRSASLQGRELAADGALGATRVILPASLDDRYYGGEDSAFAADGSGAVLTRRMRKPYPRVRAAFFQANGSITPLRTISSPGHTARLLFDNLAVAPNGRALATWLQYEGRGAGWHLEGAFREPGTTAFGAPLRISPTLASRNVVITTDIGARGDAVVTWRANGRDGAATAAIARPGQAFGAPQVLGPTGFGMHVAIAPDGAALLAQSVLPQQSAHRFQLRVSQLAPTGDAFGAPATLGDTCDCGEAENFDLALSPGGHVAIVWGDGTLSFAGPPGSASRNSFVLEVYEGTLGGALTRTAQLAAGSRGHSGAGIATDDGGDVLVGWGEGVFDDAGAVTGSRYVLAMKAVGAAFGSPADIGWDGGPSGSSASTATLAVLGPERAVALIDAYGAGPAAGAGSAPGDGSGHQVLVSRLTQ